jgi:hypothetical protein
MTALSQQQIVVEKASSVSWRSLPGEPTDKTFEIWLLFLSLAALSATWRFLAIRAELPAHVEKSGACGF